MTCEYQERPDVVFVTCNQCQYASTIWKLVARAKFDLRWQKYRAFTPRGHMESSSWTQEGRRRELWMDGSVHLGVLLLGKFLSPAGRYCLAKAYSLETPIGVPKPQAMPLRIKILWSRLGFLLGYGHFMTSITQESSAEAVLKLCWNSTSVYIRAFLRPYWKNQVVDS